MPSRVCDFFVRVTTAWDIKCERPYVVGDAYLRNICAAVSDATASLLVSD